MIDIGAGSKRVKKVIDSSFRSKYFSFDIDDMYIYDFNNINEISEIKYSLAIMLQVLEHLTFDEGLEYIKETSKCSDRIFITIPNIYSYPWVFWDDITHKTNWSPRCVCAILDELGYDTKINRVGKSRFKFLKNIISRITGIDWCMSILITGKKREDKK